MNRSDTLPEHTLASHAVPPIPQDDDGPVFREPWQAEVFAMTLTLHEQGVFTWTEWATLLSESIQQAQHTGDPDLGDTYYQHWLSALERVIVEKNIGDHETLTGLYTDWDCAARRTPHGQAISLDEDR